MRRASKQHETIYICGFRVSEYRTMINMNFLLHELELILKIINDSFWKEVVSLTCRTHCIGCSSVILMHYIQNSSLLSHPWNEFHELHFHQRIFSAKNISNLQLILLNFIIRLGAPFKWLFLCYSVDRFTSIHLIKYMIWRFKWGHARLGL